MGSNIKDLFDGMGAQTRAVSGGILLVTLPAYANATTARKDAEKALSVALTAYPSFRTFPTPKHKPTAIVIARSEDRGFPKDDVLTISYTNEGIALSVQAGEPFCQKFAQEYRSVFDRRRGGGRNG